MFHFLDGGGQVAEIFAAIRIDKQAILMALSQIDCSKPEKLTEEARRAMSEMVAKMFSEPPHTP